MANRLADSASAYLRSAAHQPIHWYPWGPEAFAASTERSVPILLDIGAVWCHWCHVMDGESYEDPVLARFLNDQFVCIKVDRDERPDVDLRYQRAVQAMTGQGGWPLTAFLLPDGQVFYGGTYFPPDGKYGRPGFRSVLEQVVRVFQTRPDRVRQQSAAIQRVLQEQLDETTPGDPSAEILAAATERITALFDARHGGFGTQPKFPHPAALVFLLHRWRDTGDGVLAEVVEKTLDGMARGGIHDQLAGGFHRYSVDARWVVPHFEKMSYDNAELLRAYVDGYLALGHERWADTARGIVRWVTTVLADPAGGYGASQDADVGLEDDGDYFTWTRAEVEAAIADPSIAELVCDYYDIGSVGEMHHHPDRNVLFVPAELAALAQRRGIALEEARRQLDRGRARLLEARARRTTPFVDPSRYTGWNGMLAGAMIRAGSALAEPEALAHGLRTLARIRGEQADPTALAHRPGGSGGILDDQVQVAAAAIDAYEATGDLDWLGWSQALLDRVWRDYHDPDSGGLFDSAATGGEGLLPTRARPVQDTPTPSPNGVAAIAAGRLAELVGGRWTERREGLVGAFAGAAAELGIYGSTLLLAIDRAIHPPAHLVIVEGEDPGAAALAESLHQVALAHFAPRRIVQRVRSADIGRLPSPVRVMAEAARGTTRAYFCVGTSCRAPAESVPAWRDTLSSASTWGAEPPDVDKARGNRTFP
jgi:uncharacterized protein YyaL (SSP411 family)